MYMYLPNSSTPSAGLIFLILSDCFMNIIIEIKCCILWILFHVMNPIFGWFFDLLQQRDLRFRRGKVTGTWHQPVWNDRFILHYIKTSSRNPGLGWFGRGCSNHFFAIYRMVHDIGFQWTVHFYCLSLCRLVGAQPSKPCFVTKHAFICRIGDEFAITTVIYIYIQYPSWIMQLWLGKNHDMIPWLRDIQTLSTRERTCCETTRPSPPSPATWPRSATHCAACRGGRRHIWPWQEMESVGWQIWVGTPKLPKHWKRVFGSQFLGLSIIIVILSKWYVAFPRLRTCIKKERKSAREMDLLNHLPVNRCLVNISM